MKTLIIDNYDSFSRILFQYLWEINGSEPLFLENNSCSLAELKKLRFDNIVISPGPGHPGREGDFGICAKVIQTFLETPILGVCLGHQGLGISAGAKVVRAQTVMHGKPSRILHSSEGIFQNLPNGFLAIRYHSLVIEKATSPKNLIITATSEDDDQIMGIQIKNRPAFGVQFHPESIGTEGGKRLLENFRRLSETHLGLEKIILSSQTDGISSDVKSLGTPFITENKSFATFTPKNLSSNLLQINLPWLDPEIVFESLFQSKESFTSPVFWLDSLTQAVEGERLISYMGSGKNVLELGNKTSEFKIFQPGQNNFLLHKSFSGDPFDFFESNLSDTVTEGLPNEFRGGWVGYFGYELNQSTLGLKVAPENLVASVEKKTMPLGLFLEPDRIMEFDHQTKTVHVFLPKTSIGEAPVEWLGKLSHLWEKLSVEGEQGPVKFPQKLFASVCESAAKKRSALSWKLFTPQIAYEKSIRNLQSAIREGESYEACLTNQLTCEAEIHPFKVYQILRRTNPSPYAAYLQFPQGTILSASPERFLKLGSDGEISSRPIKGTRKRGKSEIEDQELIQELKQNPKDKSENLMIVDLVRHDFGKICEMGTVQVADMMKVEKHPTVLQLVSTVSGTLAAGKNALDAVRACFPGGSMTGAPKLRTVQLLAAEEKRDRGVFSGALGYLGQNGSMDLGMVIRTLVFQSGTYTIGCGGAILSESDPTSEFEEILLKAFASQRAVEWSLAMSKAIESQDVDGGDDHD